MAVPPRRLLQISNDATRRHWNIFLKGQHTQAKFTGWLTMLYRDFSSCSRLSCRTDVDEATPTSSRLSSRHL